jgi:hypothetical protein
VARKVEEEEPAPSAKFTVLLRREELERLAKSFGVNLDRMLALGACSPAQEARDLQVYECELASTMLDEGTGQLKVRLNPYVAAALGEKPLDAFTRAKTLSLG